MGCDSSDWSHQISKLILHLSEFETAKLELMQSTSAEPTAHIQPDLCQQFN